MATNGEKNAVQLRCLPQPQTNGHGDDNRYRNGGEHTPGTGQEMKTQLAKKRAKKKWHDLNGGGHDGPIDV